MASYEISTKHKKSIVDVQYYKKDDYTIRYETGWRWGSGVITIPDHDDLPWPENPDDNDEIDVLSYDFDMDSLDDGCWDDIEFPDDMDEEELNRLQELYDEDGIFALEEDGWECWDAELWFQGPLEIKKVEE